MSREWVSTEKSRVAGDFGVEVVISLLRKYSFTGSEGQSKVVKLALKSTLEAEATSL